MTDPITIPAAERGIVRVFALSMTAQQAERLRDGQTEAGSGQAAMLGVDALDTEYTEIFPVADLDDLGLAGYLVEGNGVEAQDVAPDRTKLKQLSGWVMIVYSSAFGGQSATLTPAPEITLVGTYREAGVDWTARDTVTSEAARPYSAPPQTVKKRPSDAAMSGRIATLVLILLALFTWLFIWIAG
ncbi:MAG: hypothetical protein AAFP87_08365 [Pseudomonadota bacterium]